MQNALADISCERLINGIIISEFLFSNFLPQWGGRRCLPWKTEEWSFPSSFFLAFFQVRQCALQRCPRRGYPKKKKDDTSLISRVPEIFRIFDEGDVAHCNRLRLQTVAPTSWRARLENSFTASRVRWKCPSNHKRYITRGDNRCHRASLSIPISLLRAQKWRLIRRTWKLHCGEKNAVSPALSAVIECCAVTS